MNYSWDFLESLRDVFIKDAPAQELFATDKAEYDTIPVGKVKLRFTTNHDESAKMSPTKEFGDVRGSMAAFVLTTYLHGGALIYGSQEAGYPEAINFFTYVPVDWTGNSELYQEYCRLMALYNEYPAIRKGGLKTYPQPDVLLFEKQDGKDRVLVAANVRNREVNVTLPQEWNGHSSKDMYSGTEEKLEAELSLCPYQYRIFKY